MIGPCITLKIISTQTKPTLCNEVLKKCTVNQVSFIESHAQRTLLGGIEIVVLDLVQERPITYLQ